MKREARSAVKVDRELVSQVQALCPGRLDVEKFISAFTEKAILHSLGLLNLLPNMAEPLGFPRKWANFKTIRELYGWSRNALNDLVDAGEIRRCKTSDSPAGGVLYRISDIEEWMEEHAEARHCKRVGGTEHK
jgi:hypothetical protein